MTKKLQNNTNRQQNSGRKIFKILLNMETNGNFGDRTGAERASAQGRISGRLRRGGGDVDRGGCYGGVLYNNRSGSEEPLLFRPRRVIRDGGCQCVEVSG